MRARIRESLNGCLDKWHGAGNTEGKTSENLTEKTGKNDRDTHRKYRKVEKMQPLYPTKETREEGGGEKEGKE